MPELNDTGPGPFYARGSQTPGGWLVRMSRSRGRSECYRRVIPCATVRADGTGVDWLTRKFQAQLWREQWPRKKSHIDANLAISCYCIS